MIQLRPTFSESWYRVAALKARLRAGAQISRQYYRGERWYVVRDPAGNQFHRLSDAAYRFIGLLDGSRTVAEAWDICGGQLADDAPTQPEIIQILSHLYSANLIEADVTPDATVLLRRHKQLNKRKVQGRLMNALFPRIPIWDPDRFLKTWLPLVRVGFSWLGACIWLGVIGWALAAILPHWGELQADAKNAIDPKNWLYLWAVFVLIKLIHELGHAFSCRRFGGECHELGIMLLVFVPTPYVDASAAWAFPSRWRRMFVGAGGMIVELFVAAIMALCWVSMDNKTTLPAVLCYNTMLIASVSTLMFNANPLLRYDGYYILSDFLEIPNLRQKSSEYAMGLIKRHVFGVKATQPLPPVVQRFWLLLYAVASGIYRIFVGFVIVLVVAYKVPILGYLMAFGGVMTWLFVPIGKLVKYLALEPELHRKRTRATIFCSAVAAAAIILIGFVPFHVYIDGQGIAEADNHRALHAQEVGFVESADDVRKKDGDLVKLGDVILVTHDINLEATIAQKLAEQRSWETQLLQAAAVDQAQRRVAEVALVEVGKELDEYRRQQDRLTVRAPIGGMLIAPNLSDMPGSYVKKGDDIGLVATVETLRVKTIIDQTDHQMLTREEPMLRNARASAGKNDPIQVCFAGRLEQVCPAVIDRFYDDAPDRVSHPSNLQTGGGDVAPDPSDPKGLKPQSRQFEVDVKVENPQGVFYPGQRVHVRFQLEKQPVIYTWTRRFLQLLQSHEKDSKLV